MAVDRNYGRGTPREINERRARARALETAAIQRSAGPSNTLARDRAGAQARRNVGSYNNRAAAFGWTTPAKPDAPKWQDPVGAALAQAQGAAPAAKMGPETYAPGTWGASMMEQSKARLAGAAQDPVNKYLEAINAVMPALDKKLYTQPYDDAITATQGAYDAAVPKLAEDYAALRGRLTAGQDAYQADAANQRSAVGARLGSQLAQAQSLQQAQADSLKALGVDTQNLTSGFAAEGDARLQAMKDFQTRHLTTMDNRSNLSKLGAQSRLADVDASETDSKADLTVGLQGALAKLNAGKAGAEREYGQDEQERGVKLWEMQREKQKADAENAQKTVSMYEELSKQYETTGKDDFIQNELPDILRKYPKATGVFDMIVSGAGKGAEGKARALAALEKNAEALASGQMVLDPETGEKNGFAANIPELKRWIEAYYDETPRVSPENQRRIQEEVQRKLQGVPAYI